MNNLPKLSSWDVVGEDYRLLTLPDILSRYLRFLYPIMHRDTQLYTAADIDKAISEVFTDTAIDVLAYKGYLPEDVVTWAWILTERDVERAALRLFHATAKGSVLKKPLYPVPNFVLVFLLRRRIINARPFRLLLAHTWFRLMSPDDDGEDTRSPSDLVDTTCRSKMDSSTLMYLVFLLLGHARDVWPQALDSIAEMIVRHFRPYTIEDPNQARDFMIKKAARFAFVFNRALSLLSEPSSVAPYRSVPYYQKAQFKLIKRMAEFEPVLPISRVGYRGVIRVQLAHKKTQAERVAAGKQSKSWPPWKEERLGIDEHDGCNDGQSRALEVIAQLKEAGYAERMWERVAGIYAGLDTDGSPTIQTRVTLPSPRDHLSYLPRPNGHAQGNDFTVNDDHSAIWVARIKATRTVKEAWACFLVHADLRLPPSQAIYFALLEKLNFEFIRIKKSRFNVAETESAEVTASQSSLPGDGIETHPAPLSPNEGVYTRSEPPSLPELFDRMIQDGVQPSEKSIADLVCKIRSVRLVTRILKASGRVIYPGLKALTTFSRRFGVQDVINADDLALVPEVIYGAYIRHLCILPKPLYTRTPSRSTRYFRPLRLHSYDQDPSFGLVYAVSPLVHTIQLVEARMPVTRPPWIALLTALARPGVHVRETSPRDGFTSPWDDIMTWKLIRALLSPMNVAGFELDLQTVRALCLGLEKAAAASLMIKEGLVKEDEFEVKPHRVLEVGGLDLKLNPPLIEAQLVLRHGPDFIKSAFEFAIGVRIEPRHTPTPTMWEMVHSGLQSIDQVKHTIQAVNQVMLAVPGPWELHAYIRALGVCKDYDGLVTILQWMASHVPELSVPIDEAGNGRKQIRLSLTAARVSLEKGWDDYWGLMACTSSRAPETIINRAKEAMIGMEEWGGWPDDAEVESYTSYWGMARMDNVVGESLYEASQVS